MYKIIIFVILTILLSGYSFAAAPATTTATIQIFYQKYLNYNYHKTPNLSVPQLQFSTSFNRAIAENLAICDKYGEGICGWAAEGDEYLNAQETDPNLSYQNSGITITELSKNLIQVKLNVYPSIEDTDGYHLKTITYKMILEGGAWVADDIIYEDGISSRKKLENENATVLANSRKSQK